jgi:hypothetical protein
VSFIDDHSRLCVASRVFLVSTAPDVVATFYGAAASWGFPASVLSDNGRIFTASSGGDRGALATELALRGIVFKHGRPYPPAVSRGPRNFSVSQRRCVGTREVANGKATSDD